MNARLSSLLALAAFVSAQTFSSAVPSTTVSGPSTSTSSAAIPSGTTTLPRCVQDCVTEAATKLGCSATDPACVCNLDFVPAVVPCLVGCSPEDQEAHLTVQRAQCTNASTPISGSATGSATIRTSTSAISSLPVTSRVVPAVTSRPVPSAAPTRPFTTSASTSAPPANTAFNAAGPLAFDGIWTLAAGVLGIAIAF